MILCDYKQMLRPIRVLGYTRVSEKNGPQPRLNVIDVNMALNVDLDLDLDSSHIHDALVNALAVCPQLLLLSFHTAEFHLRQAVCKCTSYSSPCLLLSALFLVPVCCVVQR